MAKTPAWQRKEGKAESGGLNAKGRASYKAQTTATCLVSGTSAHRIFTDDRATFVAGMTTTLLPVQVGVTEAGEPAGYIGVNGVKLYDPAAVNTRRRVWFGV